MHWRVPWVVLLIFCVVKVYFMCEAFHSLVFKNGLKISDSTVGAAEAKKNLSYWVK